MIRLIALALLVCSHALSFAAAPERLAILGDSITYDGRWATRVESALRATPAFADAEIVNFGLPSETLSGLSEDGHANGQFPRPCLFERLERVLEAFKPTRVIACYGINDGIYQPLDAARMKAFQDGCARLKAAVEQQGASLVFVTPPLYDADHPSEDPARYDAVLDAQAAWLLGQRAAGWQVIDLRPALREAIAREKAARPDFIYAADKVHPGSEGHRFIADAVCSGLWPIWNLPGPPQVAKGKALAVLGKRAGLLKHAWLTHTRHQRPGIPAGLPLEAARTEAASLLRDYLAESSTSPRWNGFRRIDFKIDGHNALLIVPDQTAPGSPWIWRTEFFGHEPQADIALAKFGWHVGYVDMQDLYGGPLSMEIMDHFHEHATTRLGLSRKPVLEGFSRGGLFAFNWAARRPDQVAGLYVDAPVCDFKSWPGGKGAGPGSAADWQRLLKVYGMDEAKALAWPFNPVDNLAPLAKAGIPIFCVAGAADEVVPVAENIDLVEKRYRELGGAITVIRKPGGKHHPHSLPDPAPIVEAVGRFPHP